MTSASLSGWELMRNASRDSCTKDEDHIVAFVHWYLVQRSQFECLGNGHDTKALDSDVGSELLPADWNLSPLTYSLRYRDKDKVYVLLATITGDNIVFNLLSALRMDLSNVHFATADTLAAIRSATGRTIQDERLQRVVDQLAEKLLAPVFDSNQTTTQTQTSASGEDNQQQQQRQPSSILYDQRPIGGGIPDGGRGRLGGNNVGRADLDPFYDPLRAGPGGGGMLFQPPMRPGGMGPDFPGHPPGARFDPVGPLGPLGGHFPRRPNNDHFQPPGFGDFDGFM